MRKTVLWSIAALGLLGIGAAQAQYYDRGYDRYQGGRGYDRQPEYGRYQAPGPERWEARKLMQCAGYIAQIRTYREQTDSISRRGEERLESMEDRFTRESDRISGADPARQRWFRRGADEAQGDIARFGRSEEALRQEFWEKVRECRDLTR